MTSPITTHVLDTTRGRPADGVAITLERRNPDATWSLVGRGSTDADGRLRDLMPAGSLTAATYRITFDTGAYHARVGTKGFYPEASVVFLVEDAAAHYHVPLLLNPFGWATYRGS